jgi:hypothetical protein
MCGRVLPRPSRRTVILVIVCNLANDVVTLDGADGY